ncbi:MAG: Crossover junction endodeoxyribonuclease RuvC [uncultured bacterium]|nr:MAG: Crossover junction endodeoxyribonuclease RuvC [uncultured bacterium]
MIILGIDPGYGKCGWAILAKGEKHKLLTNNYKLSEIEKSNLRVRSSKLEVSLVVCDCIETDPKKDLPDRLKEIYDAIEYIIKKYQPTELAIESLFFFKNQKTVMQVSQARGVIIVAAKNHDLSVSEYTPLQVKQAVIGYGRGDKEQIQKMIKLHLCGQEMPKQDDTADAVAVALTHLQTSKFQKTNTK